MMSRLDRRAFLQTASVAFIASLARRGWADGGVASAADGGRLTGAEDAFVRFGSAPQQLATPLSFMERPITPTPVFFVRSHFGPPARDPSRKVAITGMVKTPLTLSAADLGGLPEVTITAVLQCAGNSRASIVPRVPGVQWSHGAMGQATFTGVRLKDLLAKAGVDTKAGFVRVSGGDLPPKPTVPGFIRSIPLARAMDPTTLVATRMNGEPLTLAHGAPMRLIVPGWAGDHWIKWLTTINVQAEEADGFYMQTAYRYPTEPVPAGQPVPPEKMKPLTTMPVKSIIGRPEEDGRAAIGVQEIAGVAFSGDAAIAKVEISLDLGKSWKPATLEGESGVGRWQVFRHLFEQKTAGRVTALARATDRKNNVQPEKGVWNPSGYHWNAWHRVSWEVT